MPSKQAFCAAMTPPDTKPDPDENKAFLDVEFGVYPWIVRDQDADLE